VNLKILRTKLQFFTRAVNKIFMSIRNDGVLLNVLVNFICLKRDAIR